MGPSQKLGVWEAKYGVNAIPGEVKFVNSYFPVSVILTQLEKHIRVLWWEVCVL